MFFARAESKIDFFFLMYTPLKWDAFLLLLVNFFYYAS